MFNGNSFDTMKIATREFNRSTLDLTHFKEDVIKIKNVAIPCYKLINNPNGLVGLTYVPRDEQLIIENSAKIFGPRYKELINKHNYPDVVDIMNSFGYVHLNKNDFITYSECLKLHVTKDIHLSQHPRFFIGMLSKCQYDPKFTCQNQKYTGLFFKSKAKTTKVNFKAYYKYEELILNKSRANINLLPLIELDYFEDVLRVEVELNNFKSIRKYFGLSLKTPPYLGHVLSSTNDVLQIVLDEVIKDTIASTLTVAPFTHSKPAMIDYYFRNEIYNICGEDDYKADALLKAFFPADFREVSKKYRIWKASSGRTISKTDACLKELFDKIRNT